MTNVEGVAAESTFCNPFQRFLPVLFLSADFAWLGWAWPAKPRTKFNELKISNIRLFALAGISLGGFSVLHKPPPATASYPCGCLKTCGKGKNSSWEQQ